MRKLSLGKRAFLVAMALSGAVAVLTVSCTARAAESTLHADVNPDGSVTFSIDNTRTTLPRARVQDLQGWLTHKGYAPAGVVTMPGAPTTAPKVGTPPPKVEALPKVEAPEGCGFSDFMHGRC